MKKNNILVFPCGSEIGLEIYRSLVFSSHVCLIGASSVDDHGKFVYQKYFGNFPFIDSHDIIPFLIEFVKMNNIDAIYPTMDSVIAKLKKHEIDLGCRVISSDVGTTDICISKSTTYEHLKKFIKVPITYPSTKEIQTYPVFIKPDVGYGTRGVCKAEDKEEATIFLFKNINKKFVITEYLPGNEYTVDCFTDRNNKLRFVGARIRNRISNGISVNTKPVSDNSKFIDFAQKISKVLSFRGAWFFQVKEDKNMNLTLLEIAARLGGSSGLYRNLGVNFALLSIFDAFDIDVDILINQYEIELDRALSNKFRINLVYDTIYVDYDDCLILDGKINLELIRFLYKSLNEKKHIILITKHNDDLFASLKQYRLTTLFDEIIIVDSKDEKFKYITRKDSIYIDDSYSERKNINLRLRLPVFSPDMIECLI